MIVPMILLNRFLTGGVGSELASLTCLVGNSGLSRGTLTGTMGFAAAAVVPVTATNAMLPIYPATIN